MRQICLEAGIILAFVCASIAGAFYAILNM